MGLKVRSEDFKDKHFQRSSRFQLINNKWFFKTREDEALGPYNSLEEAEYGVQVYISLMQLDIAS
ncbi:DUF6316 family protein [Aliikangiella coralliicola]|uniref:DUF6316 domain-containing protein n=1 Tax=Aliikangiella coralliicola TaxID=2592383 RepID=A0A545UCG0_9GAMM|nr:DUF6316 family protein [Aliikangiella coralliicola]TQV87154.1 hypothetical protein FLL46_15225 [Aliikangiella coralliicola]